MAATFLCVSVSLRRLMLSKTEVFEVSEINENDFILKANF